MSQDPRHNSPFFGGLPRDGVWNSVHLSAGQFAAILFLSVALFVFWDGPLWWHLRQPHMTRIFISYAFIPMAVLIALYRNGQLRLMPWLGATLVIGVIKLLLTALLVMVLGLARA